MMTSWRCGRVARARVGARGGGFGVGFGVELERRRGDGGAEVGDAAAV